MIRRSVYLWFTVEDVGRDVDRAPRRVNRNSGEVRVGRQHQPREQQSQQQIGQPGEQPSQQPT